MPMFGKEIVDLRTVTRIFQGEEFTEVTGRVVLHAMPSAAEPALCGRDTESVRTNLV